MSKQIFFVRHAQTEMNVKKLRYDNFGKDEYYPLTKLGEEMASETWKYLKTYGKFDLIISSPRDRCIQTAELIAKQKIMTDDLLLEKRAGKFNLMTNDEVKEFKNKNKKILAIEKKLEKENDEFKRSDLVKKLDFEFAKYADQDQSNELIERYKKFLMKLTKLKENKILCVGHGGTVWYINDIICNISMGSKVSVTHSEYIKGNDLYFNGNCMLLAYSLYDNKYSIVIPNNNLHLKKLNDDQNDY